MRILHVCDSFLPHMDGVIVSILNTSKFQYEHGHKVTIFAPKYKKNPNIENIKVHRFFSLPAPSYEGYRIALPNIIYLSKKIKKFKPDIVHLHGLPGLLSLFSMYIARKEKIKVVATYHTSFPDVLVYLTPSKLFKIDKLLNKSKVAEKFASTFENFSKGIIKYKPIKKIIKKNDELSRKNVWLITKRLFDQPDVVIAPSNKIDKELRKNKVGKKIEIVSNGTDLNMFSKKETYGSKEVKFLHVGRLGFEKKIDILLNSVAEVKKTYPNITLTIVGDGPARDYLENRVYYLSIEKNVKFLGFKERTKLPELYKQFEVFVTASVMETQGIVLIEAMASGLPIIGVNVLAIPDIVKNETNGFLAKKDNSKEIAGYMIKFIENPSLIKKYGENSRKIALEHDVNITNQKLISVYKSILT